MTQLIHKKANLQATDQNQNTALHLASSMGHLEIAKELIENRAEINVVNSNNETPLVLAIQNGHQEIVNKLWAKGATLDISKLTPQTFFKEILTVHYALTLKMEFLPFSLADMPMHVNPVVSN